MPTRGFQHHSDYPDPHLNLVLTILSGIADERRRLIWMESRLPRTSGLLGAHLALPTGRPRGRGRRAELEPSL